MAIPVQQVHPVAHLPVVLGVFRRLGVATTIDRLLPLHSGQVLSTGRGVEALLLAILDGHHALYKVGARLEERGVLPWGVLMFGGKTKERGSRTLLLSEHPSER